MLNILLESRSQRTRNRRGAFLSAGVHAAIIFAAVYATASGATAKTSPSDAVHVDWVPVSAPKVPIDTRHVPRAPSAHPAMPRAIAVPIEIPTVIPPVDLKQPTVDATDFRIGRIADSNTLPSTDSSGRQNGDRRAYDVSEVESPVASIRVVVPDYPAALRAGGIEGRVAAEFVVNENGRAEINSLRIIRSTNDAFTQSIREALPRMRFRAATIGGHAVAQLVQQEFVFRLDR